MNTIIGIGIVAIIVIIIFWIYIVKENQEEDKEVDEKIANRKPVKLNINYDKWISNFDKKYSVRSDIPFHTTLAGVKFRDSENIIKNYVKQGDKLMLIPDPYNKYDKTATRVCTKDGRMVGWLPNQEWSDRIFHDLQNGKRWDATVEEVKLPSEEYNFLNLLIELWEYSSDTIELELVKKEVKKIPNYEKKEVVKRIKVPKEEVVMPVLKLKNKDWDDWSIIFEKAREVAIANNMDWDKIYDQIKTCRTENLLGLKLSKHFDLR